MFSRPVVLVCVIINAGNDIYVGQAGVQLGESCWELFCAEHDLNRDGTPMNPAMPSTNINKGLSTFFQCVYIFSLRSRFFQSLRLTRGAFSFI
jgi:hypothetical protein